MTEPIQCAILGSGVAGLSAAVYAARDGLGVIIAGGPLEGGLLTRTGTVENFPGFPEGITGFELISRMRRQAERFGARFLHASAEWIDREAGGIMHVHLSGGTVLDAETVILATGAAPRMLGLEAEQRLLGHGVSVCANCDAPFFRGVPVAVAGGGNTALEDALYLSGLARTVYLIHRRDTFRGDGATAAQLKKRENVKFILNAEITRLNAGERLRSVAVTDKRTGATAELAVDGLFIAVGRVPENRNFAALIDLDEAGYAVSGENCRTRTAGIFVAGDNRAKEVRQLVTAAADGAVAATEAVRYLAALS